MTQTETTPAVHIDRHYDAPPAKVRAAWTDPTLLAKWFAPGPMTCTVQALDVKVGGQFEITMHGEDGSYAATGTFKEVTESKLAMTWNWLADDARMPEDSLLTATFEPAGTGTKFTLLHTRFPNAEAAKHHEEGWLGCVDKLPSALEP